MERISDTDYLEGWNDCEEVCDVAQSENINCEPEQSSCPPGQTSCPRENWGTSDEDQLQGWRECAACWNHYKKLHEHDEEIPKEENVGIEIPQEILEEENESVEDYQEIAEENEPIIVEQPEGIAIVDIPSEPELYEEVSEKSRYRYCKGRESESSDVSGNAYRRV